MYHCFSPFPQFGGRLVSFCHTPTTDGGRPTRAVEIHQVVTEPELVQRSQAFQQVSYGHFGQTPITVVHRDPHHCHVMAADGVAS